jgi:hypothetical protein
MLDGDGEDVVAEGVVVAAAAARLGVAAPDGVEALVGEPLVDDPDEVPDDPDGVPDDPVRDPDDGRDGLVVVALVVVVLVVVGRVVVVLVVGALGCRVVSETNSAAGAATEVLAPLDVPLALDVDVPLSSEFS